MWVGDEGSCSYMICFQADRANGSECEKPQSTVPILCLERLRCCASRHDALRPHVLQHRRRKGSG